jgi:hypothetical protein
MLAPAGRTGSTKILEPPTVLDMIPFATAGVLALDSCHRICLVCAALVD